MKKVNLHSHTQFCDAKAPMKEIAEAAKIAGFDVWGFSPHSPLPIPSPCNMKESDVPGFLEECGLLKQQYAGAMDILAGMEIDYLSAGFGPSNHYFQSLPLDYRIGSVHFLPNRKGQFVDCDGSADRFKTYLGEYFNNDVEYVVKKYFEQVLEMISAGGFDILGHCDKIIGNVSETAPEIEHTQWYADLVSEVIYNAVSKNLIIEINTKAHSTRNRFYPDSRWWSLFKDKNAKVILSTDAHYPAKVDSGFNEALQLLNRLNLQLSPNP